MNLPNKIKIHLTTSKYQTDEIGLSDSKVYLFDDQVLKIQEDNEEARNECQIMKWLEGKLPVPKPVAYECENGRSYLLMTRVEGKMSCDEAYMRQPALLTKMLADALKTMWQIDVSDCPCIWNIDRKLKLAKYWVEHDMVDVDNVEPDTYGPNGFDSPRALFQWLTENKPQEEPVLSHGDFTLPNILFEDGHIKGYIDLGRMGVADKWQDISLCYRSLQHNFDGKYNGKKYDGYHPDMLFKQLGIEPDWDKIRYYILLDELF